jgi:hypothetical protein
MAFHGEFDAFVTGAGRMPASARWKRALPIRLHALTVKVARLICHQRARRFD